MHFEKLSYMNLMVTFASQQIFDSEKMRVVNARMNFICENMSKVEAKFFNGSSVKFEYLCENLLISFFFKLRLEHLQNVKKASICFIFFCFASQFCGKYVSFDMVQMKFIRTFTTRMFSESNICQEANVTMSFMWESFSQRISI